ncbi:MAG: helix-turn-helix domain-containing protein, partial [Lachnospiraceae bacterium]|nr:helix-turn-helix domain-containing protein [Lachnospiraceae bacterium]
MDKKFLISVTIISGQTLPKGDFKKSLTVFEKPTMNFHECLNEYINKIDCTSKELSAKSGLSGATISRYRSGEREPSKDSDAIRFLADALFLLAEEKGIEGFDSKTVYDSLSSSLNEFDFTRTAHKFDLLIEVLKINASELASALNYDP